jgi:hypothetical protein
VKPTELIADENPGLIQVPSARVLTCGLVLFTDREGFGCDVLPGYLLVDCLPSILSDEGHETNVHQYDSVGDTQIEMPSVYRLITTMLFSVGQDCHEDFPAIGRVCVR